MVARFFIVFIFILFSGMTSSFAQDRGLVVNPKRIVFNKDNRILEVMISNRGEKEATYRISMVNKKMLENGQLELTQDPPAEGEFWASDVVRYSPRKIVLAPKESQKIRLMSRLKADSKDGEYRSHLLIQQDPDMSQTAKTEDGKESQGGLGIQIKAVFGVSIPVILRKGSLEATNSLSDPEIVKVGENTFLQVKVNRSGNKSVMGTLKIYSGDQVVGLLKGVSVYLSVPHRIVQVQIGSEFANSIAGKPLRVVFDSEAEYEDATKAEVTFTP